LLKIIFFWSVTLHRRLGFFEMSVDRDQSTQSNAPEEWLFKHLKLFCFVVLLATLSVSIPVLINQGSAVQSSGFCDELWNIYMNFLKYHGKIQISLEISLEFLAVPFRFRFKLLALPSASMFCDL